jgi:hypothetical protein
MNSDKNRNGISEILCRFYWSLSADLQFPVDGFGIAFRLQILIKSYLFIANSIFNRRMISLTKSGDPKSKSFVCLLPEAIITPCLML